jgi:hypothetical protein
MCCAGQVRGGERGHRLRLLPRSLCADDVRARLYGLWRMLPPFAGHVIHILWMPIFLILAIAVFRCRSASALCPSCACRGSWPIAPSTCSSLASSTSTSAGFFLRLARRRGRPDQLCHASILVLLSRACCDHAAPSLLLTHPNTSRPARALPSLSCELPPVAPFPPFLSAQDYWFTASKTCVPNGPSFDYTYYNTYTAIVGAFTGCL